MTATYTIKLQKIIVAVAIILLSIKFIAYLLTNSTAVLTDGLESIINVVAGLFGLFSLTLSAKPKDEDHPYGHGKIEFVSATIEGAMIILAGIIIIGKSVYNLFYPHAIQQIEYGIILIAFTGIANFFLGRYVEQMGNKAYSPALIAGGKHLQSDGWSSAGLLIGLFFIYILKFAWLDSAIAILFALYIIYTGMSIVRKSVAGIMDEADTELLNSIINTLDTNRLENWVDIHNLRVIKYGSSLHIDCHLTVPYYFTVQEGHEELETMEALIQKNHHTAEEWFVHVDACVPPAMCQICIKSNCTARQLRFEKRIQWTNQNVLRNQKHGL